MYTIGNATAFPAQSTVRQTKAAPRRKIPGTTRPHLQEVVKMIFDSLTIAGFLTAIAAAIAFMVANELPSRKRN